MFLRRTFGGFIVLASAHPLIRDRSIRNLLPGSEESISATFAAGETWRKTRLPLYFREKRSARDQHGM